MEELMKNIEEYVKKQSEEYKNNSDDQYDFWEEHIKYVYQEAITLAEKYGADESIVKLGALLHDIALMEKVGDKKDHHIHGKLLSNKILEEYHCPTEIKERVLGCVYHHRSSKNATNVEELCVCDADILAHFDNIPMLFQVAFSRNHVALSEVRQWMLECFEKDYSDLSDRTKEYFREKYERIKAIVICDEKGKDRT